jgi:ABC-type glycerol-3-phosphate transport system permease component
MVINIYLIIGVSSLLVTIFYLIGHLNQADSIIKYCIPGFVLGVSSGIIYFLGYQSMISEQQDKKRLYLS